MDENEYCFKVLKWEDVRDDVKKVNPELAEIIDKISPDKRFPLIKASYRFGDLIVKDGVSQLPTQGGLLPIASPKINSKVTSQLSYSKIPLSILLNKASEIFIHGNDRIIPLNIFYPGRIFGTFETLNFIFQNEVSPIWNVSAGSRIIFTLPKTSEVSGFNRLKTTYGISSNMRIMGIGDHWNIFKHIANHHNFTQKWKSDVIFFSKEWFLRKKDPAWFNFMQYLFKEGWMQSQYAISKFEFGILWQEFVKAIYHRKLKPTTYISDTVKHLLSISIGSAPGIIPDDGLQLIAPTNGIKHSLTDIYKLKDYFPTIMQSGFLNQQASKSVYYSLNFPTVLEGTPEGGNNISMMIDLKDIKLIFETLNRAIAGNKLFNEVNLDYFHVEEDKFGEIKSSKLIIESDARFLTEKKKFSNREFCASSGFWRGCIKITKNS